ncbi:MAG: hypothetical protein IPI73_22045 [Betaproteobacteria bacterium]|nr:hypothetical protein [Betaproteobacteria bacterium]
MPAAGRTKNGGLDIGRRHRPDACQEIPLVGVRAQVIIDKDAATVVTRYFLQRQCDQIAKSTLWQSVLVGKQAVV